MLSSSEYKTYVIKIADPMGEIFQMEMSDPNH